jgi:thiol:disulfide interchange protein DsbD
MCYLNPMRSAAIILFFCLMLAITPARAAHTNARLMVSAATARPGDTVLAGVQLKMEPGWHTYWKNPGEAGQATEIQWQLPPGISAGAIQWPLPKKIPPAEIATYGYTDEVVLLVPLTLASNLPSGPLPLAAKVSWLECQEACIPGSAGLQGTLDIGSETRASADAALLAAWKSRLPETLPAGGWSAHAWWEQPADRDTRPLMIEFGPTVLTGTFKYDHPDFFPESSDSWEVLATTEEPAPLRLRKQVKKLVGNWPGEISGVIVVETGGQRKGFEVKLPIGNPPSAGATTPAPTRQQTNVSPPPPPFWQMLLYAFIGGLILNIMPCVLPVIALKILGFVNDAQNAPRRVRQLGLIYALGVLVSFLALAALVIGVQAAGRQAGWGMQFGSPVFLVSLTTLVTLVTLNLFGVFEVILGGRAGNAAGGLAARHGAAGAFFNGVLATALATPCTAPFLGLALGFAFAQSPALIVLVLLTVGFGLAAPYVALSWNPAWLKFLPRPGAWMEKFKIAMGFPMLATTVWLFNLAAGSYGKNILWLGIFLVTVAFAAWIFGEFSQRGRRHPILAAVIALILLLGGYFFALEKGLDWRHAQPETATGSLRESPDGIDWQPWSPAAVDQARAAGRPVLVDFTADWCLTCLVNKKTSLEIPSVREKIRARHVVALLGDYTHTPDRITAELNRFQRAGVPLVLVYPSDTSASPLVLPEVLTPGIVLNALDRATK